MTKKLLTELTYEIIGAGIEVRKTLGSGLLESVYHKCLKHEFFIRNMDCKSELLVPVAYKGINIDTELKCDFLIENSIVLEIKATDTIRPIYEAQLLTYMKLLKKPKGILINFNCLNLYKDGQKTYVNELYKGLPDE